MVNDPLYNHTVFGPERGRGGNIGKSDEDLIRDLISIHNAENWLGIDGDTDLFKPSFGLDDEEKGDFVNIHVLNRRFEKKNFCAIPLSFVV